MKPEIIILDEPMSNLDPKTSSKILKLLLQLNKELGLTLIIATHDVDLVPLFADEICILNKGQIVLQGPPQEVFTQADTLRSVDLRLPRITHLFEILGKKTVSLQAILPVNYWRSTKRNNGAHKTKNATSIP